MKRVDLPANAEGVPQWAMLRSKEEITTRGRRGISAIAASLVDVMPKLKDAGPDIEMSSLGLSEVEIDAVMRMQEATVVAFVAAWSLPDPVPTLVTVGDLPADLYDALSLATAKDGADVASLHLDAGVGSDTTPDPKELSGVSESSDGLLKDETVPAPIQT